MTKEKDDRERIESALMLAIISPSLFLFVLFYDFLVIMNRRPRK